MELNELILLASASLLAGSIQNKSAGRRTGIPTKEQIEAAVTVASDIWKEVLRQDN